MHGYDEPVYPISVVAKVLIIHPQTLRQYEREGLISPSRTGGKMRLYSQHDIDRIKTILRLTRNLGVNLAGVDIVLQLKESLDKQELMIEEQQKEIMHLRSELSKNSGGSQNHPIVKQKQTSFNVVVFGEYDE